MPILSNNGATGIQQTQGIGATIGAIYDNNLNSFITPVRVLDIILDNTHPRFEEFGEWNSIGAIFYEAVNAPINLPPIPSPRPAYPLLSNIKQYPLINEITYLMVLPSNEATTKPNAVTNYYLPPTNLWNSQFHNALPREFIDPNNTKDDYISTEAGSYRQITDSSTDIYLGKTFNEANGANNYPLLPYEGDVIYEGRWGNSIRLGSTVKNTANPNRWSDPNVGENGDPILIIRNGQGETVKEPWIPKVENINNDPSSIYLTSTQKLSFFTKSNIVDSFEKSPTSVPTTSQQYSGNQIVLNSGRLVFNAKSDSIILSSEKSIHLSSNDMIGLDGNKQISISAPQVYLGSAIGVEGAQIQPLVLGDNLNIILQSIATYLDSLGEAFQLATAKIGDETAPIIALNSIAQTTKTLSKDLNNVIKGKNLLSKQVKTV